MGEKKTKLLPCIISSMEVIVLSNFRTLNLTLSRKADLFTGAV